MFDMKHVLYETCFVWNMFHYFHCLAVFRLHWPDWEASVICAHLITAAKVSHQHFLEGQVHLLWPGCLQKEQCCLLTPKFIFNKIIENIHSSPVLVGCCLGSLWPRNMGSLRPHNMGSLQPCNVGSKTWLSPWTTTKEARGASEKQNRDNHSGYFDPPFLL